MNWKRKAKGHPFHLTANCENQEYMDMKQVEEKGEESKYWPWCEGKVVHKDGKKPSALGSSISCVSV